ncbi:MAG: mitochondrial fission ELM1 family protein [Pseudomonadota bacterium]|nr:mitochondrial fission ELM1 family protein [Pseudomonadota bacterium]
MENQCLGLAEALNAVPVVKRISISFPWSVLPPKLWPTSIAVTGVGRDQLRPPWPDILIATGRQTVAPALAIKRASAGRTFCVQIQNPTVWHDRFDLLAIPAHDQVKGDNVFVTTGALNRVTRDKLERGGIRARHLLSNLPRPLVSVLVGGSNRQYRMTNKSIQNLGNRLAILCEEYGAGIAVTTSRRTGPKNEKTLRALLAKHPCWFWDGTGENPYFGLLELADAIIVTADSVSMISEACSTGTPVYVADLDRGSAKFRRFHQNLRKTGITRQFEGRLESWKYNPLNDTVAVAAEVLRRFGSTHSAH